MAYHDPSELTVTPIVRALWKNTFDRFGYVKRKTLSVDRNHLSVTAEIFNAEPGVWAWSVISDDGRVGYGDYDTCENDATESVETYVMAILKSSRMRIPNRRKVI